MTTPNQPVPVGLGAFEIDDGGGPYQYGQDMTESIARAIFLPGFNITDIGSLFDALDALRTLLLKLPLEALHAIQTSLPDLGGLSPFPDVTSGVESIISSLIPKETIEDLKAFILSLFGGATTEGGAENFISDLLGLFGSPTGLGSGSPSLPGIGSIPILGGLLSGGGTKVSPTLIPDITLPMSSDMQGIADIGFNIFNFGSTTGSTGNPLSNFADSFLGIHGTGKHAESVNVTQDAQIGGLLTGGSGVFDTFDGASASSLDSALWDQTYFGSGSGTYGLSGSGAAKWNTSGITPRGSFCLYRTRPDGTDGALSTNTQQAQLTLNSNIAGSTIGQHAEARLQVRSDAVKQNYVEARFGPATCEIGVVIGGTYTRLGTTVPSPSATSGTWVLKAETLSSPREFVLLLNGAVVLTRSDSTSMIGGTYRYCGHSVYAGETWFGGLLFFQLPPPDVDSWGANDRLAAF